MSDNHDLTMGVLYPSKYLKADDLRGKPVTVTIAGVALDDVVMAGGSHEQKVVISLAKTLKLWIAGKTNGHSLAVLLGSDGHQWIGKRVVLIADVDRLGRDVVPCIRVQSSPDAPVARASAYEQAWRGTRERGALVARLKVALALLDMNRAALPPIDTATTTTREPGED